MKTKLFSIVLAFFYGSLMISSCTSERREQHPRAEAPKIIEGKSRKDLLNDSLSFIKVEGNTIVHSDSDNQAIVKAFGTKCEIPIEKQETLLREMAEDERLADLIHQNPDFNIKRWLNARNHVDKSKVARQPNGKMVLNGGVYAGNVFYLDPALNKGLNAKLKASGKYDYYTFEDLIELDKKYPNGVRYTEKGYPDFIGAGACKLNDKGEPIIFEFPDGHFTGGGDAADIGYAQKCMKELYGDDFDIFGYTWHHLEEPPARLVLVDYDIHRICKHTGGNSLLN